MADLGRAGATRSGHPGRRAYEDGSTPD
jgi:hypothetical protein